MSKNLTEAADALLGNKATGEGKRFVQELVDDLENKFEAAKHQTPAAKPKVMDPELRAMSQIDRLLAGLEAPAKIRVLQWLFARANQEFSPPGSGRQEP